MKDKYGITADEQLANKIYVEWMKRLTAKASPLFYFNRGVWREDQTAKLAFVSIPDSSAPIKAAATQMYNTDNTWSTKESALTDRIFVMCSACALPLSSYNNCAEYETSCFSSPETGRHYYEGKPVPGMLFTDWRKLSSLTPQSLINLDRAPDPMKIIVGEAQKLYDEATQYTILDDENRICKPSEEGLAELKSLIDTVNSYATKLTKASEVAKARELLEKLQTARSIPMVATRYAMQNDGYAAKRETKLSVQKDHFVSAPVFQGIVKEILAELKAVNAAALAAETALKAKIEKLTDEDKERRDYCEALFTGVITYKGNVISFQQDEYSDPIMLSQYGDEFAFKSIPVYQAFVSYCNLLNADNKATIKKRVNNLFNYGSPDIKTVGTKLKAEFTSNKVQSWRMGARNFPEETDILEFIKKFMQMFEEFCMQNDI